MTDLRENLRPTPSVIKLVESCGILLGIPPSNDRFGFQGSSALQLRTLHSIFWTLISVNMYVSYLN